MVCSPLLDQGRHPAQLPRRRWHPQEALIVVGVATETAAAAPAAAGEDSSRTCCCSGSASPTHPPSTPHRRDPLAPPSVDSPAPRSSWAGPRELGASAPTPRDAAKELRRRTASASSGQASHFHPALGHRSRQRGPFHATPPMPIRRRRIQARRLLRPAVQSCTCLLLYVLASSRCLILYSFLCGTYGIYKK